MLPIIVFFSKPKKKMTTKKILKNKMTSAMSLKVPGIEYIERILSTWTTMKLKSWKRETSPWSLSYPWTGQAPYFFCCDLTNFIEIFFEQKYSLSF